MVLMGNGLGTVETNRTDVLSTNGSPSMRTDCTHDVTALIESWQHGDSGALSDLFDRTWRHLHDLAGMQCVGENADCTLQATSLVNEAFLRLAKASPDHLSDRRSFFCTTARAMKQIRIEQARKRKAVKRGGKCKKIPLEIAVGGLIMETLPDERLLLLSDAMEELKKTFPDHYDLTMLLYCAGFSTKQAGNIMGIAQRTVQRDWKFARAFLKDRMQILGTLDTKIPA
jgi:RNA polymerase sigma factor (TIGR02999 family)